MSHFRDNNTLKDILGAISLAQTCPPDIDINSLLEEIVERIQNKLALNKNKTRHNWFASALEFAKKASVLCQQKIYVQGEELQQDCGSTGLVDPEGNAKNRKGDNDP